MSARFAVLASVLSCLAITACDPSDACDRGYFADHGYCYLSDAGFDWRDASEEDDAGALDNNPSAMFGTACVKQSDCGGVAPVCGGPMLPLCTQIQCIGTSLCPTGWQCFDVTKYMQDVAPGVTSVCIPAQ